MPVPPYNWQVNDFLSAYRLNSEMYAANGQPFAANGPRWHAMRPVYKSYGLIPPTLANGIWSQLGTAAEGWGVVGDTAALLGSAADPNLNGTVQVQTPNSGGLVGSTGGVGLVSAFPSFVASGSGSVAAGIGPPGSLPASTGTVQSASTGSDDVTPFAVDLVNIGSTQTGFALAAQATPALRNSQLDGSGDSARLGMHWASVYPANGSQVSAIPAIQTYLGLSNLSSSLFNSEFSLMSLLNMPPIFRVQATSGTSQASSTNTTVNFPSTPTYDTYGGWNGGSNTYTCPLPGLYLIYGCVPQVAGWTGITKVGFNINGSVNFGPRYAALGGFITAAAKVGVFNLAAGTTVSLTSLQNDSVSHSTASLSPYNSVFLVVYLGPANTFSPSPTPPDTTFAFQAGASSSSVLAALNNHVANDLLFMAGRPYLMVKLNTGVTVTTGLSGAVPFDTVLGDNFGGWSSFAYTVPVAGWYLAVCENQINAVGTSGGAIKAQFQLGTSGIVNHDTYQQQFIPDTVNGYGASALGYYYLRAGEIIQANIELSGGPATYTLTGGSACHFELVWLSN